MVERADAQAHDPRIAGNPQFAWWPEHGAVARCVGADPDTEQAQRCVVRRLPHECRIEQVQATHSAHRDPAIGEHGGRAAVEFDVLQAVRQAVPRDPPVRLAGRMLEPRDAVVGAQPERAFRGLGHAEDRLHGPFLERALHRVLEGDPPGGFADAAEARVRPDPERPVGAFVQRAHQVSGEARGILDAMAEPAQPTAGRFVQSQAVACGKPDAPFAVHFHRVDQAAASVVRPRHALEPSRVRPVVEQAFSIAAQPQRAIGAPVDAAQAGHCAIRQVDLPGGERRGIEQQQAPRRRRPEPVRAGPLERHDPRRGSTAGRGAPLVGEQRGEILEPLLVPVAQQVSRVTADPQRTVVAFDHRADAVRRHRRGTGAVDQVGEARARGVGDGHAADLSTDPELAAAVDQQRAHRRLREAARHRRVFPEPLGRAGVGIETDQALRRDRQPQAPIGRLDHGADIGRWRPRCRPGPLQRPFPRGQPEQPVVAPDPQPVVRGDEQGVHRCGRTDPVPSAWSGDPVEASAGAEPDGAARVPRQCLPPGAPVVQAQHAGPPAGLRVQPLEAGTGPDPGLAILDQQAADVPGVVGRGREALEITGAQVQPDDVLGISAHPYGATRFDLDRGDEAVGQARTIVGVVAPGAEAFAIEPVQAALGADPHESLVVLVQRGHGVLCQALFGPQPLEVEIAHGRVGALRGCQRQAECAQRGG